MVSADINNYKKMHRSVEFLKVIYIYLSCLIKDLFENMTYVLRQNKNEKNFSKSIISVKQNNSQKCML
jgi:hypothetical protein